MAKLLCVFSTLASSVRYVEHKKGPNGMAVEGESVLVKGGAGVANEHIQTPRGVPTLITAAQRTMLDAHPLFKVHKENGYVSIGEVERKPDDDAVEKAVADMTGRDASAPTVPEDFTANGQPAPTTGAATA